MTISEISIDISSWIKKLEGIKNFKRENIDRFTSIKYRDVCIHFPLTKIYGPPSLKE